MMNSPASLAPPGLTLDELSARIDKDYAKILRHPEAMELFRALDNELYTVFRDRAHAVLMTSAADAEGKTSLVLLLGVFSALLDREAKVVLIDASDDQRLFRVLVGEAPRVALVNLESEQLEQALCPTLLANLQIVSLYGSGNAAKKLPHHRLSKLLDLLLQRANRVVVDSSAAHRNRDVFALAAIVKHSLTVVKYRGPIREQVQVLISELERAECKQLGVVINQRIYNLPAFLYRHV
ncbi:hypothetical protein [Methylomonas sp. HYX-M1]|uniref:hypothetical protein n=1 Tax=Methylomonas sp. HYX-M1 TaxID=3139307 RepID=UPI00345C1D7D